jgi:hypothetical protein
MLLDHPSDGLTAIRTQFGAIFASLELESFELAGNVAFAWQRREDVQAWRHGRRCCRIDEAL